MGAIRGAIMGMAKMGITEMATMEKAIMDMAIIGITEMATMEMAIMWEIIDMGTTKNGNNNNGCENN